MIIILIALIGSIIAGLWDLRTTEVPDPLPIGMVVIGIVYWVANWLITGDAASLIVSVAVGTALLAAGLLLYKKGQWGGADAWILAAIGYMIPVYNGELFILPYILNFMVVSIAYTVVYSLVVGMLHAGVFRHVAKDFAQNAKTIAAVPAAVLAVLLIASMYMPVIGLAPTLLALVVLLVMFWRYATVIEKHVFRKKIPTSKLRKGDVLETGNWIGLTDRQIKRLRRERRYVVIKDGMRFVPVFAIALALTLLYGNLFFALL